MEIVNIVIRKKICTFCNPSGCCSFCHAVNCRRIHRGLGEPGIVPMFGVYVRSAYTVEHTMEKSLANETETKQDRNVFLEDIQSLRCMVVFPERDMRDGKGAREYFTRQM